MGETVTLPLAPAETNARASETTGTTFTLAVENMHCGGCIRSVEKALLALPGVLSARVNLSARRVVVDTSGQFVEPDDLIDALSSSGFKAAELNPDILPARSDYTQELFRALGVAGFAALNIMLLSVSVWSGGEGDMAPSTRSLFHWLSALIALPAVAYAGQPFFRSAWQALRAYKLNMDVPISLGVLLATLMSLFQTIRGTEQVYFDAAVTLLAFLLAGRLLDQLMRARASGAAANLLGLRANAVNVVRSDGTVERVPLKDLPMGARVLAAAGEQILADGLIRRGQSEVEEGLITGETLPRAVKVGDRVFAGTVNLAGPLVVETTTRSDATLISEIARMMAAAEQARGVYVNLADRAAQLYAPAVHLLAAGTFAGWMIMGAGWEAALTTAIAVLIITCPCALALAVPVVQVAAASRLFAKRILLKESDGLERMADVDTVVFDKTGTLTTGELYLRGSETISDANLLEAANAGANSRHPLSRALVRAAQERGLPVHPRENVEEVPGQGLRWVTAEGDARLGSAQWCDEKPSEGSFATLCFRPARGKAIWFRFEDRLRDDASEVIARLKTNGFDVELLSGDREETVALAARSAGIGAFRGECRPDQKIAHLKQLKDAGRKVLMVGDGLNDAPSLAAAHASLSPAGAADITQTAADAVFQDRDLHPILETLAVSKAARRMMLQNFGLAIGYNSIFVPLAVLGYVTPLIAAVAMSLSSITVIANAVRLRTRNLELSR